MRQTIVAVLMGLCAFASFAQDASRSPSEPPRLAATPPKKSGLRVVAAPIPEVPGAIRMIRIYVTTGADDLRAKSEVRAFVELKGGGRLESHALNCERVDERNVCPGYANGTRKRMEWHIDPPTQFQADQIHRFGLAFLSGRNGPFDTGDNWNLQRLEVEYIVSTPDPARGIASGTFPLLKLTAGRGVYRFKTNEEWQSEPLTLGSTEKR